MNEKEQEAARVDIRSGAREGAISRAAKVYAETQNLTQTLTTAYESGFDAGIQHSRLPADGWREINGVEDLPKEDGRYLVTVDDDSVDEPTVFVAQLKGEDFVTDDYYEADIGSVVAWMPWPAPYTPPPTEGETNNAG